jgi:(p)ppGpp synthase/HD superfamily hydrolase
MTFIIRRSAQHKKVLHTGDFFTLRHLTFDNMVSGHLYIVKYYNFKMISGKQCLSMVAGEIHSKLRRNKVLNAYDTCVLIEKRVKTMPRIVAKIRRTNGNIPRDILGMRVIYDTNTIPNTFMAYYIAYLIEEMYEVDPGYRRDYIENPKENGYQSLHMNVSTLGHEIEIQIRNKDMHECAESGTASNYYDN